MVVTSSETRNTARIGCRAALCESFSKNPGWDRWVSDSGRVSDKLVKFIGLVASHGISDFGTFS